MTQLKLKELQLKGSGAVDTGVSGKAEGPTFDVSTVNT